MPSDQQIRQWLDIAIALHQRNRTAEARIQYIKVLTYRPDDPDANHLLALIEANDGHREQALERLLKARRLDPNNPELLSNLGGLYRTLGQGEAAIEAFRAGLALSPELPALHNNLGVANQDLDRHEKAIESFRAALALQPDYAEAHNNLGVSLLRTEGPEAAIPSLVRALDLAPDYVKAVRNLEAALLVFDQRTEKETSSRRFEAADPVPAGYVRLGQVYQARKANKLALAAFDKALALVADSLDIAVMRASCLIALERPAEVAAALSDLIERTPDNSVFHAALGQAHAQLGAADASIAALRQAIAIDPDNTEAYQLLAQAQSLAGDDALFDAMQAAYGRTGPDSSERMRMSFALAKACEDREAFRQAFSYLVEANRLRHESVRFDVAEGRRRLQVLRDVFTPGLMAGAAPSKTDGPAPIFILGMPRSGTTLVESILGSHHVVTAGGELNDLPREALRLGFCDRAQPPLFRRLDASAPYETLAKAYLAGVRRAMPTLADTAWFTDKMPDNFWNIGLIRLAFPDARIVHCRRAPADTCLSLYKTDFNSDGHRYAYDLDELGAYYNLYRGAMQHWEAVLPPGSIITVDYETLVADQEAETRRLIAACGLDWDDRCLSFYDTARVVHTASFYQVRRPIYASSVNLAERYGDGLKPLLDALEGAGINVAARVGS